MHLEGRGQYQTNFRTYSCVQIIDKDVKRILLFIVCKIFYAVDIWCCYCCTFIFLSYYLNLYTRHLYEKKRLIYRKSGTTLHMFSLKVLWVFCLLYILSYLCCNHSQPALLILWVLAAWLCLTVCFGNKIWRWWYHSPICLQNSGAIETSFEFDFDLISYGD